MPSEAKRLAKWTDRYDVIQGSRLDFDGGAFFWQYQLILSLGIPNPIAKWDLGPEGYRAMNQLCFEGGLFSRRVVDKIGLPDARFFIYGDDACYGYVASQHFPAAVVADVVLKRARAVSNWDIAGKRQLNSTSDTNRYYIMRNRGYLARYMQIVSEKMIEAYPNRIINIHHSFLPAFVGARPYHAAYERGVKIIGATSHYVTTELDAGPIIEQEIVRITHKDTIEDLVNKGKDLEKIVLSRAVQKHIERKVLVYKNKTVIFN